MSIFCYLCYSHSRLTVNPDGSFDCSVCGHVPLKDHMHCQRCGFACQHVECAGIHYCPNCGDPKPVDECHVAYDFNYGCSECGLSGHLPKPGYMEYVMPKHPRAVFGLTPEYHEEDVEFVMSR